MLSMLGANMTIYLPACQTECVPFVHAFVWFPYFIKQKWEEFRNHI